VLRALSAVRSSGLRLGGLVVVCDCESLLPFKHSSIAHLDLSPAHRHLCHLPIVDLTCLQALLSSAFTTSIPLLILTQGVIFGIGILLVELPTLLILNTWFISKRGLAYGLLYGICDLSGVALSFVVTALLKGYGLKVTFLALTAICVVLPGCSIAFLRERRVVECYLCKVDPALNDDTESVSSSDTDNDTFRTESLSNISPQRHYLRQPIFYVLMLGNFFRSLGYYLPFIYLPSFATALGESISTGAIVLAVANASQIIGELAVGAGSDYVDVHLLAFWTSLLPASLTFFVWGNAKSLPLLIVYAIFFSATGSGYTVLWPRMGTLFNETHANQVFGLLSLGRGIGAIVAAPISAALITRYDERSGFTGMIMSTGASLAVATAFGGLGWMMGMRVKWRKVQGKEQG
jgi:hypothetical protein